MRAGWGLMVLAAGLAAHAQEPGPAPLETLKLGTRVVAVSAVVLDAKGEPVRGLAKDNFTLKQDGKPQEIRYFSEDADLPLTLALLVDTSGSQRMFLEDEVEASEKFFSAMLTRPLDHATLVQFDNDVLQLQAMTSNVQALENRLRYLTMRHPSAMAGGRGGTLLYDAVVVVALAVPPADHGRRAMVILTDGEDNGSRSSLDEAVAAAQRADIVVYSVLYSANEFMSGGRSRGPGGREVLQALSNATGGRVFTVNKGKKLEAIFGEIADDLRLQYQIGYNPPTSAPGAYHKVELKVNGTHLTVQARKGYYSPK